jgi:thioredoxin-like negative regulator of GroEL
MTASILVRSSFLSIAAMLVLASASRSQSPEWRTDYAAARTEATAKNKPLIIDFVTENCFWCKKLDSTTFRDPAIVALMNEQFIPLKIDANGDPAMASKLQIQSYPTVIIAAQDGRILTIIEGYVESPKFLEQLQKAVPQKPAPSGDWMARDFQDAEKAIGSGDNARAIALLKTICEEDKNLPIQTNAKKALKELEKQADNRLAHARRMEDQGQILEALDILADLMRVYAGSVAANEAKGLLTAMVGKPEIRDRQRSRRARELLAQARDEFRTQQFHGCLEKCELLAANYADVPEGVAASQLAGDIKNNPDWLAKACKNLDERLSEMYLTLADSWMKKGKSGEATACLEKVRQLFPNTPNALVAQIKIGQIQGKPSQQTDFKK